MSNNKKTDTQSHHTLVWVVGFALFALAFSICLPIFIGRHETARSELVAEQAVPVHAELQPVLENTESATVDSVVVATQETASVQIQTNDILVLSFDTFKLGFK